jgi:ketosteroid isomerase-like protein
MDDVLPADLCMDSGVPRPGYCGAVSQENVELYYRAHDAFNRRDIDAFLALSDSDVEFTPVIGELEGSAPYHGHDGIRSWWEDMLTAFSEYSTEIEEVRDLGNVTVARGRARGRGMESDAPIEQTFWQVVEVRNGKAVWWCTFWSEVEALEAAGLRE